MKNVKQTFGIDVSKLTFDIYVKTTEVHQQFSNDAKGFKQFVSWLKKSNSG